MFDLITEIDEIRLEYLIRSRCTDSLIYLSISDVEKYLNINRSKAQRLIQKFIKLDILHVLEKSSSRNTKTLYTYNDILSDTKKPVYYNDCRATKDIGTDSELDIVSEIISMYRTNAQPVEALEGNLHKYKDLDPELIKYLARRVLGDRTVRNSSKYLLTCLMNAKKDNIETLAEYLESQEKGKIQAERKKQRSKNWNYQEDPNEVIDFDEIVRKSKLK